MLPHGASGLFRFAKIVSLKRYSTLRYISTIRYLKTALAIGGLNALVTAYNAISLFLYK